MNGWNLIPWSISIIALVFTAVTFYRNGRKDIRNDAKNESSQFEGIREGLIKANIKLDQVCAVTNETRTDIKSLNKDIVELDKRMSVIERDVKTAFMRIDELRNEINKQGG
jgi:capsule polysaccharide export protein KpsE/RkpR